MPPKKRVLAVVKIQLPAGGATPAPPVGTALGPHGVQTMEFCKQYNAATENQRGIDHPRRDLHLRGPDVLLRPEDPADPGPPPPGRRPGEGGVHLGPRAGGHRHQRPGGRDRRRQAPRPEHRRHRGRQAPGGGHGPVDGDRRRRLRPATAHSRKRRHTMSRGKSTRRASPGSTASISTRQRRRSTWSRPRPRPGSTRQWRSPSDSGSIPARPIRSCAGRSPCPPGPGERHGSQCSPPVRRPPRPGPPAPTWWAPTTWWPGWPTTGSWSSTWPSPRRT